MSRIHIGSLVLGAALLFVVQWFLTRNKAKA